jgi:hypothetical protein
MSRIITLSTANFSLMGRQKKTLNINVNGNVLVFFKMVNCQGCQAFEPVFVSLARSDSRVTYAIVDVAVNKEVVMMSRETTMPIQSVPTIVFYTSGRPFMKFTGKKNEQSISSFITKALQTVPSMGSQPFIAAPPNPGSGPQPHNPVSRYPDIPSHQITGLKNQKGTPPVEDDDNRLMQPEGIIAHNVPWESGYRKLLD